LKPNKLLLVLALVALAMCVSAELGGRVWLVRRPPQSGATKPAVNGISPASVDQARARIPPGSRSELERPGLGISYLAMFDALLLVTYLFIAATVLLPERSLAPAGAATTLIVSLLVLIASVIGFFAALGLTLTMVGLLLALPFGTIVYLAIWGSFPVGAAAATLGVILFCKLAFGVCLLIANPRFLQNKLLVILAGFSLLCSVIVSFLQGLPPGILASITDGIAAIVVAVISIIFAIVLLVRAIIAIVKIILSVRLPSV
jgi:hypothetical protein